MNVEENIQNLEHRIGYEFKDKTILRSAITHSSYRNELKINKWDDYQRLEFLGDAVLEIVVSEYLYHNHKDMAEGALSRLRAAMVCEYALAYCAGEINLGDYILLGKGEKLSGGNLRPSILCDVFEAVIGAIYLDGGFDVVKDYITRVHLDGIVENSLFVDSKSLMQEKAQAMGVSLAYELVKESGPDHDKSFEVALFLNGKHVSNAIGHNKKEAEQKAAFEALKQIEKGINECI